MKIFITGNAGSGKTTLSKKLSSQINLPLFHLDTIVWLPGWRRQKADEIQRQLINLVNKENWVIDGVSSFVMDNADIIIFLDVPLYKAYWRALKRTCKHLFKQRPEMPANCSEISVVKELVKIIWYFHTKLRYELLKKVNNSAVTKKMYHIKNNKELFILIEKFSQLTLNGMINLEQSTSI